MQHTNLLADYELTPCKRRRSDVHHMAACRKFYVLTNLTLSLLTWIHSPALAQRAKLFLRGRQTETKIKSDMFGPQHFRHATFPNMLCMLHNAGKKERWHEWRNQISGREDKKERSDLINVFFDYSPSL